MAQVSSGWQQLVNLIQNLPLPEIYQGALKQLSPYRSRRQGTTLLVLTVVVAMLIWNWKLVLATSSGVLLMLGVYLLQQSNWQGLSKNVRRFLRGSNRHLAIAVGTGGTTALYTYMVVSIWVESENHWMATGAILQGVGTMATLILLLWHIISHNASLNEANLNELMMNLTEADPLKRLISIRQLTSLVKQNKCEKEEQGAISDYFRLMLSRETEPLVREALLDGLQTMETLKQLGSGSPPLTVALKRKRATPKVRHRIYDYER